MVYDGLKSIFNLPNLDPILNILYFHSRNTVLVSVYVFKQFVWFLYMVLLISSTFIMTPSFLIDNWSREGVDGIVKSGTVRTLQKVVF